MFGLLLHGCRVLEKGPHLRLRILFSEQKKLVRGFHCSLGCGYPGGTSFSEELCKVEMPLVDDDVACSVNQLQTCRCAGRAYKAYTVIGDAMGGLLAIFVVAGEASRVGPFLMSGMSHQHHGCGFRSVRCAIGGWCRCPICVKVHHRALLATSFIMVVSRLYMAMQSFSQAITILDVGKGCYVLPQVLYSCIFVQSPNGTHALASGNL